MLRTESTATLALIRELCDALEAESIAYCHWKSNAGLPRSASGEADLDLLVREGDADRLARLLLDLGFVRARPPRDEQLPGVLDYYGHDRASGRLVHVHAHLRLVLGHDASKNYCLPIEESYLASATRGDLFWVPAPEHELVVFVIRMVLKHSTWDAILGRQGRLSSSEREELIYLESRATRSGVAEALSKLLPDVAAELFEECLASLRPGCPPLARARAAYRLERCLRKYARRPYLVDLSVKLRYRVVRSFQRRAVGHEPRRRLIGRGLLVAIVGGDGSGKTTVVNDLHAWVSEDFEAIRVHLGKPRLSLPTIAVRGVLKGGKMLGLYPFMRAPVSYATEPGGPVFPGYPWLLREVCTARDRKLAYLRARRFADEGGFTICDRFPLSQIKLMDGAEAARLTAAGPSNALVRFLVGLERRYYQAIGQPDLLIVLRADPEVAVCRKTEEKAEDVRARCREVWELDWRQLPARVLDAGRPRAEVLARAKAEIWARIQPRADSSTVQPRHLPR